MYDCVTLCVCVCVCVDCVSVCDYVCVCMCDCVLGISEGGVADLIRHNSTGYLTQSVPSEQSDFTAYVNRLADSPALRQAMGEAGRLLAQSWSWEKSNQQLREVLYPLAIENFKKRRIGFWGKYKHND